MYIPPNTQIAETTLRHLKWFLLSIFLVEHALLIVVAGDFKTIGMKKSDFLFTNFYLNPVLGKEKAIYKLGGHLEIFCLNFK